jgi:cytochrome c oxidase assembly factor CtaG
VPSPSLLTPWSFEPLQIVPTVVVAYLYVRRMRTLAGEGRPVSGWRQASFWTSMTLIVLALNSPIDALGEQHFFFLHMTQHVLIGDLAPLCFMVGLTGQVLRPVLAFHWVERLRILAHPLVALPIWAVNLYVWHIPYLYDAALHHDAVHALEHFMFFTCGCLMWAPVVETLPAPAWFGTGMKLGYIVAVRVVETILGNVFIWSGGVFYTAYEHPVNRWGISAHADQGIAGGVMMLEGSLVTLGALAWLFLRWARESEERQQLLDPGVEQRAATRAVRYGRGSELSGPR